MIRKRRNYKKILTAVVPVVILIIVLFAARTQNGSFGILNRIAATFAYPFEKSSSAIVNQIDGVRKYVTDICNLYSDNQELRRKNAELLSRLNSFAETENENIRLKKLLETGKVYNFKSTKVANVIAYDIQPFSNSIVVDLGEDSGIKVNMPVIVSEGLVGAISEVYSYSSRVRLITSPDMAFSATIQRFDARTFAMAQGMGNNEAIKLDNIPQNIDVIKGDRVVTRGLGGLFPIGLLVGEVSEVKDSSGYLRTALVKPSANIYALEQVLVITDYSPPRKN